MGQLPGPEPDFVPFFTEPSIEQMLSGLTDHQFEHFVKYVFEQAGYFVEDAAGQYGQGLDLKLYVGPASARALYGGVSVKHFTPPNVKVDGQQMMLFRGAVINQMQGYTVTTSTFNGPALIEAKKEPQIWAINGEHLVRYIDYVRGTREVACEDTEPDPRLRINPLVPIPPEALLAADEIEFRDPNKTTILTVANHKGGVGKTTTALNLAFGLAALDQQVLLVDTDSQANLTRDLPVQAPDAVPGHLGDYFARRRTLASLVRQTQFKRVWLIPSSRDVTRSDVGIAAGPGAEARFVRDLHAPEVVPPSNLDARPFDWIIIDTGPSMGLFTRSALAASHCVLVTVAPSPFADLGTDLLLKTVNTMQALTGRHIHVLGCLVTQWKDDATHQSLLAQLTQRIEPSGLTILAAKVPLDKNHIEKAHLETGSGQSRTLFSHHKTSKATQGYVKALQEILSRGKEWGRQ